MSAGMMRIALAPIAYFWEREAVFDFYRQAADSAAEIIYLGEIVCSKRRNLGPRDYLALAEQLREAGKEVVLSSLTLLEAASELGALKRLCANRRFMVEANDISAIQLLSAAGIPFVSGPSVNIYNQRSLRLLAGKGLKRWVLPVELGMLTLRDLQAERPAGVETEVFACGRLPLAWSARCYTARSFNLPKDHCQFKCGEFPDGRLLKTQEGQDFLVLNGTQTQSALTHQALEMIPEFQDLGVDVLRISPQSEHTFRIAELFEAARRGGDLGALQAELLSLLPLGACNGYLHGLPGMDHDAPRPA
ncbi:MAG TPA: U32 family peptidase [Xanthomonadales bacterium]|nr:U32 family peptidase [Xanthomonadales bacterium]